MKKFFSIALRHEYHQAKSEHLVIVPATSNNRYLKNDRLRFREDNGYIHCFIEDDKAIKETVKTLYFWVVSTDESFFRYTDYTEGIRFTKPHYYWSNTKGEGLLQTTTVGDKFPKNSKTRADKLSEEKKPPTLYDSVGVPPRKAIGCIAIQIDTIETNAEFFIDFKVKHTLWEYRIQPKTIQKKWNYRIEDEKKEWEFIRKDNDISDTIIFRSRDEMEYLKKADNRLNLIWEADEATTFQQEHRMILPFANHAYKMVSEDNKALTPIYIHI